MRVQPTFDMALDSMRAFFARLAADPPGGLPVEGAPGAAGAGAPAGKAPAAQAADAGGKGAPGARRLAAGAAAGPYLPDHLSQQVLGLAEHLFCKGQVLYLQHCS